MARTGSVLGLLTFIFHDKASCGRPNIVIVLADDLGFGDVGWNNPRMEDVTSRITEVAEEGTILSQYYVQPVCSPSRYDLAFQSINPFY